ncbi:hypothetical protein ACHAXT_007424 [Thalassiosira profunda]
MMLATLLLFALSCAVSLPAVDAKPSILQRPSPSHSKGNKSKRDDAYTLLARSIQTRLNAPSDDGRSSNYDVAAISSALRSLSATNAALKKIDGTAHEMYQRTHKSSTSLDDEVDGEGDDGGKVAGLKVAGRMSRNAARVGCIADAMFAAELCELILLAPPADGEGSASGGESNPLYEDEEGTLGAWTGRKVVLNTTIYADPAVQESLALDVLVIYEPEYAGGAGIDHGGVDDLLSYAKEELEEDVEDENGLQNKPPRGRYLVVLSESGSSLSSKISILDSPPEQLRLHSRGENGEAASVCGPLYHMAGRLLEVVWPVLLGESKLASKDDSEDSEEGEERDADAYDGSNVETLPAIHFAGHSLAGGIAALAAIELEGTLPSPKQKTKDKKHQRTSSMSGSARGRTSAICLGPPPCVSSNLQSPFVTSVIDGDDIICRTTQATLDHLCSRVRRTIKGGFLGKSVGWMSEAVSITTSGLKSNKGKEERLAVPGKAFLVRPRRIGGGSSSIHEVGGHGREALRAAVLWQLNDVLLSKSLWSHHKLDAYIRSLDKVRLKGFADDPSNEEA